MSGGIGGRLGSTTVDPNREVKVQKPSSPTGPGNFDDGGLGDTPEGRKPIDDLRDEGLRRLAEKSIAQEWIKLGGPAEIGVLGKPLGGLQQVGDGEYSRDFEAGSLRFMAAIPPVPDLEFYVADVDVAAIRCFGTEDPGGLFKPAADEPYLIITAVAPSGAFLEAYRGNVVKTWRSQRFDDIRQGEIFGTDLAAFQDLVIGPKGLHLKLLMMEHEHGDEEELRKKIEEKGNELAKEIFDAASLIAGLNIDDATRDQVLDSEILSTLGDLSVSTLTTLLQDDKIDEKTWWIPGDLLKSWADNANLYENSGVDYNDPAMAAVKTNFPREGIHEQSLLFSGGGGSYKVFLRVTPKKVGIGQRRPPPTP